MRSAFALRINSGRIIFVFGIAERLRAFRYPIFTGRGVKASGSCCAGSLRKHPRGETAHFALKPENFPPCQGLSFGRVGIEQREMTERARMLAVLQKALPEMVRPPLPRSGTSFLRSRTSFLLAFYVN